MQALGMLSEARCCAGADKRALHVGGPRVEPFRLSSGRTDSIEGGCCDLDACPRANLAVRKAREQLRLGFPLGLRASSCAINKTNGETHELKGFALVFRLLHCGFVGF